MIEFLRLVLAITVLSLTVLSVNIGFATMDLDQLARADALFRRLEKKPGFSIIRNGGIYTLGETAMYMRYRLYYARNRFGTVEEFIIQDALKPSIDGTFPQLLNKATFKKEKLAPVLVEMLADIDKTTIPAYSISSKKLF